MNYILPFLIISLLGVVLIDCSKLYDPEGYCKVSNLTDRAIVDAVVEYFVANPDALKSQVAVENLIEDYNITTDSNSTLVHARELSECFWLDSTDARAMSPVFVVDNVTHVRELVDRLNITYGKSALSFVDYFGDTQSFNEYCANVRYREVSSMAQLDQTNSAQTWGSQMFDMACYLYVASNEGAIEISTGVIDSFTSGSLGINGTLALAYMESGIKHFSDFQIKNNFNFSLTDTLSKISYYKGESDSVTRASVYSKTNYVEKMTPVAQAGSCGEQHMWKSYDNFVEKETCRTVAHNKHQFYEMMKYKTDYAVSKASTRIVDSFLRLPAVSRLLPAVIYAAKHPHTYQIFRHHMNNNMAKKHEGKVMDNIEKIFNSVRSALNYPVRDVSRNPFMRVGTMIRAMSHEYKHREIWDYKVRHALADYAHNAKRWHQKRISRDSKHRDMKVGMVDKYKDTYASKWMHRERYRGGIVKIRKTQDSYLTSPNFNYKVLGSRVFRKHIKDPEYISKIWSTSTQPETITFLFIFEKQVNPPFEGYAPWQNNEIDLFSGRDWITWIDHCTVKWFTQNTMDTIPNCMYPFPMMPDSQYNCAAIKVAPFPYLAYNSDFNPREPGCLEYKGVLNHTRGYWYITTNSIFNSTVNKYPGIRPVIGPLMYNSTTGELPGNLAICLIVNIGIMLQVMIIGTAVVISVIVFYEMANMAEIERQMAEFEQTNKDLRAQIVEQTKRMDSMEKQSAKMEVKLANMQQNEAIRDSQIQNLYSTGINTM